MYFNVCLNCREEFDPIEGNETREFCSWDCEEVYQADRDAEYAAYDQGFGRNAWTCTKGQTLNE